MNMWLKVPEWQVIHGFSTRKGGVSSSPFESLNLSGSDDDPANIQLNRKIALEALGLELNQTAWLKQIHSADVLEAKPGVQTGDALVCKQPHLAIAVAAADCYPVLFHDPVNRVIGAAHCGWKGTLARLPEKVVVAMEQLGAKREHIKAAIGPGISVERYEVGEDLIAQFKAANFSDNCFQNRNLNLRQCNLETLLHARIEEDNIWVSEWCTYDPLFFSHRRDKGLTGRMWAVISL
jgi:hypothetical protein